MYTIEGKRFFTFGGAASHDIKDGILDPESFATKEGFKARERIWTRENRMFRVKNVSWWAEEMPSEAEMQAGFQTLQDMDFETDFVVSHCMPNMVASVVPGHVFAPDALTLYFDRLIQKGLRFERWISGHYHTEQVVLEKYQILYKSVIRLI